MATSYFISAVYNGINDSTFKKGNAYVLKVSFDETLIFPVSVEYKFKSEFKFLSYKSIISFLREWTEIITTIDQNKAEKSFKYSYEDCDDLPFKVDPTKKDPPRATLVPLGAWRCTHCKALNYSPSASRCVYCNEVRPEFEA